jgi:hypothetical protein
VRDYYLVQWTSWWGKRLDPKEFWKGRVLWCDRSAVAAACSHGRLLPPIPYDDPLFRAISDQDYKPASAGAENYGGAGRSSSREAAFWDYFKRTHPMPPEQIELDQRSIAQEANTLDWRNQGLQSGSRRWDELAQRSRGQMIAQGCPPEALSDEALRWAYIMNQREEYQAALAMPAPTMTLRTNLLFRMVSVDLTYITGPLANEQVKAANAWKIAYLQRLRREKVDLSYIVAYLKAWNLSSAEVFPQDKQG